MKLTTLLLLAVCLHVSANGYTQEVTLSERKVPLEKIFTVIKKQTNFNFLHNSDILPPGSISLKLTKATPGMGNLDEMQVIAYGTTTKRFATGNVATVKVTDIEKQPVDNPWQALQGQVLGMEVTPLTGIIIRGVTMHIQGRNSIIGGLNPLDIKYGVLYSIRLAGFGASERFIWEGSPLNYINPIDIELIAILKDVDATAIYGSLTANGAILITTKKLKDGITSFKLNFQLGWGKVTRKLEMTDVEQYPGMRYEAFCNKYIEPVSNNSNNPKNINLSFLVIYSS